MDRNEFTHEMQPENLWYAFGLRHFNEFHIYCILAKSKNCTLLRVLLILNATWLGLLHKVITTKYGHHNRYGLVCQLRIPSPPRWLHAAAFAAVESSAERPSRRGAQCNKHYMHCTGHRLSQASWSEGEKHLPSWGLSKKLCQNHVKMTVMIVAINECIRWLEIFLESTFMLPCDMPSAWWKNKWKNHTWTCPSHLCFHGRGFVNTSVRRVVAKKPTSKTHSTWKFADCQKCNSQPWNQ